MNQPRTMKRLLSRSALLMTAASFLTLPLATSAFAGKEGVFLSDSVYFTLDRVLLSTGADDSSLRFTLDLTNNSPYTVDFNNYGVKVVDANGYSYTARLSEKVNARVKAGDIGAFKFASELPASVSASDLKVDIFRWNDRSTADIGVLSVEAAMAEAGQSAQQQAVINLKDIDSTLAEDSYVTAQLGRSYKVFKDNAWMVYTEVVLENLGTSNVKLPDGLETNLMDNKGLTYTATFSSGGVPSLLPQQPIKAMLAAAVPASLDTGKLNLLFSPKGKVKSTVLGSLNVSKTFGVAGIGDKTAYPPADANQDVSGLVLSTTWAAASKQPDGLHVQANVTLTNTSDGILTLPSLSGQFQAVRSSVIVSSSDNASRSTYLSPNESTTYRFSGILPASLGADALQLVVLEKQAAAAAGGQQGAGQANAAQTALPVAVTSLAGAGSGGEVTSYASAQDYTIGTVMPISSNTAMDSNVDLSLVEMGMSESADFGYKTIVAKYKLTNKGTSSVTLPDFQSELTNADGYTYTGVRQTTTTKTIAPNTSYVLSYSYMVPGEEKAEKLALQLYDPNRMSMGAYKTAVQPIAETGPMSIYPFSVDLKDFSVSATYNKDSSYAYRMRVDLNVTRQAQVITDANFSSLSFEVVDTEDRLLSSKVMTFTGQGKILSGIQFIEFGNIRNDQLNSDVRIKIYEVVTTPNGDAKRLLRTLEP
ncbi:hypothetical protein [Paenibacillus whitsoniae]|uniref:DUF4352 domain-containing protein n=1 Tax=Paenibacillus whitsoniae TaxID=2496558 RepID=A0A430JJE9_9BACL|nr:hypothetical protein [Paenibacillus whitsoniae]RTE11096.1 hypothetical protein EJQ19_03980 [Paenibacillus whitsoniae]